MGTGSFIDVPVEELSRRKTPAKVKRTNTKLKDEERGCKYCPARKTQGINKIMGAVYGREIAIIVQSPGPEENKEGIELIGPSGEWLWAELEAVDIKRKHCDIQNVMRCFPADWAEGSYSEYLKMRNPSKEELHCCSKYTDEMKPHLNARQILIFGKVAALQFLKTRSLPTTRSFWSDEFNAKVYLLDHPSFFIRGYGKGPKLDAFRSQLKLVATDRKMLSRTGGSTQDISDQYGYLKKQDYRLVTNGKEATKAERILRSYAVKGKRITVDIESAKDKDGNWYMIAVGFSPKPGLAFTYVTKHRDIPAKQSQEVIPSLKSILIDRDIQKAMHFGCSDEDALREQIGIRIRGWTHDTMFSEYLRFSDVKAYGLDNTTERRFPMLAGYKTIICRDLVADNPKVPKKIRNSPPGMQYKWLTENGDAFFDLSKLSLETLRLYNGGDCDVTKRIEVSNKKHIPQALMQLYIDLSRLLHEMEPRGPLFDYEHRQKLAIIYPAKEKILRKRLKELAGDKNFNPGSPDQVYNILYGRLGLEYPFDSKPNTSATALTVLGHEHEFPRKVLEWRSVAKVESTYLASYEQCARANNNRLRTKWYGTGTRTGRLSSGGDKGKKGKTAKKINLQNIKRDPQMQNMLVADTRWPVVYAGITKILKAHQEVLQYWKKCDEVAKANKELPKKKWLPKPKVGAALLETILEVQRKIEAFVRKHIPDLKTFLAADFGQVEVRVAAQMARDKNLIADCLESDIHTKVGVVMTGWDPEDIKNDENIRALTKNVHFGILFGIAKKNLVKFVLAKTPVEKQGIVTEKQIHDAFDAYFERYYKIAEFIVSQRAFAKEHKHVKTLFGMLQTLNVTDDNYGEDTEFVAEEGKGGSYWGNQAINGPIQGTAHQIMICALVNLIRMRKKYKILGTPPLEVHDALYFAVPVLQFRKAFRKAKYLLEQESLNTVASDFPDIKWKVPIVVDVKAGIRLGSKVHVDESTTPGSFLLDWYRVCKKQLIDIDRELEIAARVA